MPRPDRVWVVYSPARDERDLRLVGLDPEPGRPFELDASWAAELLAGYPCVLSISSEPRQKPERAQPERDLPSFSRTEVSQWERQQRKMRK